MCQPLVTLHDHETWSATHAKQPWTKKYDMDCLKKEGAQEWSVTDWARRRIARGNNKNNTWSGALYIEQSARSSPEMAVSIKPFHGQEIKALPRNFKNEHQLFNLFKPAEMKIETEKNHKELKLPSMKTHHEVMTGILTEANEFLEYLRSKESECLAMSMSNSSSCSL